jgi:ABC-type lipoprotein release transport system permease subunit
MDAVVGRAQAPWRLATWMFVLFGALAFGLSALGLFSLVALEVAYRRREFAIRLALGSPARAILEGVLLRAGRRVAAGLVAGFAISLVASRALGSLLFGIAPLDAPTYAIVLVIVLIAVAIAAWLPARPRAAERSPHRSFENRSYPRGFAPSDSPYTLSRASLRRRAPFRVAHSLPLVRLVSYATI